MSNQRSSLKVNLQSLDFIFVEENDENSERIEDRKNKVRKW